MKLKVINMLFIIVFIGTLLVLGLGCSSITPSITDSSAPLKNPFDQVKEYAMSCPRDSNGNYVWMRTLKIKNDSNDPGVDFTTTWIMAYEPKRNRIGMAKWTGEDCLVLVYYVNEDRYEVALVIEGLLVQQQDIPKDQAMEMANGFFKDLVDNKII